MRNISNNFILGISLGLIVPVLAFVFYALLNFPDRTIQGTFLFYQTGNVTSQVISLSVLGNLLPFFGFLNKGKERTAQGIIGGSFVYVFIVLFIMFLK